LNILRRVYFFLFENKVIRVYFKSRYVIERVIVVHAIMSICVHAIKCFLKNYIIAKLIVAKSIIKLKY
jgi:hypothetical protein